MRAIAECGLNLLQFHGDEPSEFCTQFGLMSLKAIRVRDAESLKQLENFQTDAFLLDAYSKSGLGGTGEKFNWDLAVDAQKFGKPIFLAGGLTPENVARGRAEKFIRLPWMFPAAWNLRPEKKMRRKCGRLSKPPNPAYKQTTPDFSGIKNGSTGNVDIVVRDIANDFTYSQQSKQTSPKRLKLPG